MQSEAVTGSGLAAHVKSWLTWFAGAIAGMTALLFATGYLSMRAHANLLGLTGFVQFDHDEFLQEGARFFLVAATTIGQGLLAAQTALIVLAMVVLTLWWATRRLLRTSGALAARLRAWSSRLRWIGLVGVGALFLASFWADLSRLRDPLCIANILFTAPDLSACPAGFNSTEVIGELRDGASPKLRAQFADLLFSGLGHVLFLAFVAAWLARPLPGRRWLVLPFIIVGALMLLMLPMTYGVMVKPVRFPRLALTFTADAGERAGQRLYLVRRDDQGIVAWAAQRRSLVWWPLSSITRAEVDAVENPLAFTEGAKP